MDLIGDRYMVLVAIAVEEIKRLKSLYCQTFPLSTKFRKFMFSGAYESTLPSVTTSFMSP
jgi:hypothetical protein